MSLEALTQRVEQMEDLIADLPDLVNLRFENVTAGQAETTARLSLVDKQLANLIRDVRDLRGGVTRLLIAQEQQLAAILARLPQ